MVNYSDEATDTDTLYQEEVDRQSITFILGEDKDTRNPYYAEAAKYYRNNAEGKTTYMIDNCRSLTEVRDFLVKHAPTNNMPWGKINLVSHGDQWLGLSVKVTPDSRRTTLDRLNEFIETGTFLPLPDSIIDSETEIDIHACGIGNNTNFVETFSNVFRSESYVPQITAPRLFEFYSSKTGENGEFITNSYMANVWMITYKRDEQPGNIKICNLLHEKYPDTEIDWQDALSRELPRYDGDTYSYSFNIPVNMVVNISNPDSIPSFNTSDEKLQWINQQSDIIYTLSKIQIPAENFSWDLKKGFVKDKTGKRTVAISVKGSCTILCILRPITENKSALASCDTAFFYKTTGKAINIKS
jgi:hypothetical protein